MTRSNLFDLNARQDTLRIHNLRRTVWKGGIKGCAYGIITGTALTWGVPKIFFPPNPLGKFVHGPPQNKMLVVLICGAVGSTLMATHAGNKEVIFMGDVFQKGKKEQSLTQYQDRRLEAQRKTRSSER